MRSEHGEQVLLINWVRKNQSQILELGLLHAIPNGGTRSPQEGKKLKAEGVLPGIPDLFLPCPIEPYHGLYIELKRVKGSFASKAQIEVIQLLRDAGYKVEICHGYENAIETILSYLGLDDDRLNSQSAA